MSETRPRSSFDDPDRFMDGILMSGIITDDSLSLVHPRIFTRRRAPTP